MPVIAIVFIILSLVLGGYHLKAFAIAKSPLSESVIKRLMLDDFNRSVDTNNIGGKNGIWTANSDVQEGELTYTSAASDRSGDGGNALYLSYLFNSEMVSKTGFRLNLNGRTHSHQDH